MKRPIELKLKAKIQNLSKLSLNERRKSLIKISVLNTQIQNLYVLAVKILNVSVVALEGIQQSLMYCPLNKYFCNHMTFFLRTAFLFFGNLFLFANNFIMLQFIKTSKLEQFFRKRMFLNSKNSNSNDQ